MYYARLDWSLQTSYQSHPRKIVLYMQIPTILTRPSMNAKVIYLLLIFEDILRYLISQPN